MTIKRDILNVVTPMLIAFVVTFGAGLFALSTYPEVSPIDELQHLDYTIKASKGQLVLDPGELVGEDAMRIQACSGIDAPFQSPPCDDPDLQPSEFQEFGINTASKGLPNPYYTVTGALTAAGRGIGMSNFDAARIANLLVHALGAALVAGLTGAISRSALVGTGLGSVVGVLPQLLSQGVTVNPDSWSLLAGSTFVALTAWRHRFSLPAWVLLLSIATITFGLIKPNWVLLVVLPFTSVCARWFADRDSVPVQELVAGFAVGVLGLAVLGGTTIWSSLLSRDTVKPPMDVYLAISDTNPFNLPRVGYTTLRALVPYQFPPVVDSLAGDTGLGLAFVWGVLLAGAALTAVLVSAMPSKAFILGLGGSLILALSPVMVYVGQYLSGSFFEYPERYSYFSVPILAASLSAWQPLRKGAIGVLAIASSAAFLVLGTTVL